MIHYHGGPVTPAKAAIKRDPWRHGAVTSTILANRLRRMMKALDQTLPVRDLSKSCEICGALPGEDGMCPQCVRAYKP